MSRPKQEGNGSNPGARAFVAPVLWIAALVAGYWVIADWQSLPDLISATLPGI